MKVRIIKQEKLDELKESIKDNLNFYRDGHFKFLKHDITCFRELQVDFDDKVFSRLKKTSNADDDLVNCHLIHKSLSEVSPFLACDERLWAYFTHVHALEYTRTRWPVSEDDQQAVKQIRDHFFCIGSRGIHRNNAVARLWWSAYMCFRVPDLPFNKALRVLLYRTDVRENIMGRPTTSQSLSVFGALVSSLYESYKGDKALFHRSTFRAVMENLNLIGGYQFLDCFERGEVKQHIPIDGAKLEELREHSEARKRASA